MINSEGKIPSKIPSKILSKIKSIKNIRIKALESIVNL